MECGHVAEVLCLRSLRSGNCCYFRFVVFVSVMLKKFVIYVHQVGGRTLFLTGEASRFPSGPAKREVFNEADPCTLFSDI
jgi:hypothetical protein